MKVTSCDCFKKIGENLKEHNRKLEIEETTITEDMKFETKSPYVYLKSGRDGIKKKEYLHALARKLGISIYTLQTRIWNLTADLPIDEDYQPYFNECITDEESQLKHVGFVYQGEG